MNKKVFNAKLWRRTGFGFSLLLVVALAGNDIAMGNEKSLNHYLNCDTFKVEKKGDGSEQVDSEYFKREHKDAASVKEAFSAKAEQVEEEGLVLLKNDDHALPLAKNCKISVFGTAAAKVNYSVSGSSSTTGVEYPLLDDAFKVRGISVNPTLMEFYRTGEGSKYGRTNYMLVGQANECPWEKYDATTLGSVSTYSDAAVVMFARDSGEGSDIGVQGSDGLDGSYLSLSQEEKDLLIQVSQLKAEGKVSKVVVLLNAAVPIETDFLFDSASGISVDSCLWIGNVGTYGLYGVADVLVGNATPSGRLNDTFLKDNMSSPAMASWLLNGNKKFTQVFSNKKEYNLNSTQQNYAVYQEGIYVGYRYYETRYEDRILHPERADVFDYSSAVSFPFGYGMSYTDFTYTDMAIEEDGDNYVVSVKVTNTGDTYSGKEAVEVYLQKPYTDYDVQNGIEKASVELVGFGKTDVLAPSNSEIVSVSIPKESFKSYDANGAKTYILDEGDYYLTVGHDSHDAINNILAKKGKTTSGGMDAAGNADLAKVAFSETALDTETYSKSIETGKPITNQLDFMDVNRYEHSGDNHVTYVSRHDWAGTWPKSAVSLKVANAEMAEDLASDKAIDDTGYEMPKYGINSGFQLINLRSSEEEMIPYDDPRWNQLLDQLTYEEEAELLTSAAFNTIALPSVGKPATKDNDGPTAIVGTKTSSVLPSKGILASTFNQELIQEMGKILGEDTLEAGFQSLYAPGINLHRTPFGGRLNEYYSEDPFLTGEACVYEVKGLQSVGVIPTVKHFAFNNEETNRNGVGIWMNEQEAREIMLKPYEMALRPSMGNAHGIMTSFNRAGCVWTSASEELMININRDEYGFDGYSLTDMAASNGGAYMLFNDGIANGTDLFLGTGGPTALNDYKNNAKFAQRMRESTHRVLYVVCNFSAAMNGVSNDTIIVPITPWWKVTIDSLIITSIVLTTICVGMFAASMVFDFVPSKKKPEEQVAD